MTIRTNGQIIGGSSNIVVDEFYTPESSNAQSGTAVTGAISELLSAENSFTGTTNTFKNIHQIRGAGDSTNDVYLDAALRSVTKGTVPSFIAYRGIRVFDSNGFSSDNNLLGSIGVQYLASGNTVSFIRAYYPISGTTNFASIGVYGKPNGTGYTYCPTPNETDGVNQIANVKSLRDRSTFANSSNRITMSVSTSTAFTAPADGLMMITMFFENGEAQASLLLGDSNGYVLQRMKHKGSSSYQMKAPFIFPARKSQQFYISISTSGTGTVSVDTAYMMEFPYQGV